MLYHSYVGVQRRNKLLQYTENEFQTAYSPFQIPITPWENCTNFDSIPSHNDHIR